MKSITFLSNFLFLFISCFWSCSEVDVPPINLSWDAHSASEECTIRDTIGQNLITHRIRNTCANQYINDYKDYLGMVTDSLKLAYPNQFPNIENILIRGAKVSFRELKQILLNSDEADDLYVMMGIMEDGTSQLIFSLISPPGVEEEEASSKSYDFTMPCPTYCPD